MSVSEITPYKKGYSDFFSGVKANPFSPEMEKHQYREYDLGWKAGEDKAWAEYIAQKNSTV